MTARKGATNVEEGIPLQDISQRRDSGSIQILYNRYAKKENNN